MGLCIFQVIIFECKEYMPHATPLSANPTQYREIIINSHNVTTKLAHHDVSAGANNVSHYLLISPITSHNILCPLQGY